MMAMYVDLYDSRNYYIGEDGEYQKWNIDPKVIEEAADVVEVVRCKDCVYSQGHFTNTPVKCGCGYGTHGEDFFCADGERRTE